MGYPGLHNKSLVSKKKKEIISSIYVRTKCSSLRTYIFSLKTLELESPILLGSIKYGCCTWWCPCCGLLPQGDKKMAGKCGVWQGERREGGLRRRGSSEGGGQRAMECDQNGLYMMRHIHSKWHPHMLIKTFKMHTYVIYLVILQKKS